MSRTLILIRHGESNANAERRWQGTLDSGLSDVGIDQVARLGKRFAGSRHTRLISSDLDRAARTAAAVGEPELNTSWREFNVGGWDGLTHEEIEAKFPGQLEGLFKGEDILLGGGDRLSDFNRRIAETLDSTVDAMDDGDTTIVVTHGGVIWSALNRVLDRDGPMAPAVAPFNTSLTKLRIDDAGGFQLSTFNDASHLDDAPDHYGPEGPRVTLVRHGQTEGNVLGRWQGRSDSDLTELGRSQAEAAAGQMPAFDTVFTSPLGRTTETARILTGGNGNPDPVAHEGLVEMSFGEWEDLTIDEAKLRDPGLFHKVYVEGVDVPRGTTGESFTEAGIRMRAAVADIGSNGNGDEIGAISHGAVIRAYVTSVLGLEFPERNKLPVPRNTSMSRIVLTDHAPVVAAYNVAPHLD
ncbi:MAG: histidine phosphatase family protein [Acidimicrobiia bacterium]